jgi:hypothetical protein
MTAKKYVDNPVIPRLWLNQGDVRPETIAHHMNRYRLAVANHFLRSINLAAERPDVVTFFEAIEHVERSDGHAILDSVQTSLTCDGYFFVSTPRDIRSDVNPDHITQWDFDELHDALGQRFGEVQMFGQDWATGEFTTTNPQGASFYVAQCSKPLQNQQQ